PLAKNSRSKSAKRVRQSPVWEASRPSVQVARSSSSTSCRWEKAASELPRSSTVLLITSSSGATTERLSLTSILFIRLERCGEMPFLQGEGIGLRLFTQTDPNHRATLLVHFQHVAAGGGF